MPSIVVDVVCISLLSFVGLFVMEMKPSIPVIAPFCSNIAIVSLVGGSCHG